VRGENTEKIVCAVVTSTLAILPFNFSSAMTD